MYSLLEQAFAQRDIPIDVWWREMEELVFKGEVRSIGLSNFTKLQLQGILGCCRIRPCCLWTEAHPWSNSSAMEDLIEFCLAEGIAFMSHTPLAQGSRLDDERLANVPGLTPAQAALRSAGGTSIYPKVQSKKHYQQGCSKCNAGCSQWDRSMLFFNTRQGVTNPNHDTVCRKVPSASSSTASRSISWPTRWSRMNSATGSIAKSSSCCATS